MKDLNTIAALVKTILEDDPATRNSDELLYLRACQKYNPSIAMFPFGMVLPNYKQYDLPAWKSVERARRRIQAKYPELASDKKIKQLRTEQEAAYKEFAKEGVI